MSNEIQKQCKSKDCSNPVLKGKYCEQCTRKRKEIRDKIFGGLGGAAILGGGVAIKKGAIKQAPKAAAKIAKIIFKI